MENKIIELIQQAVGGCSKHWAEVIAKHLIENGATIAPCKIGDKVYQKDSEGRIYTSTINNVIYCTGAIAFDERAIGKSIFLSEQALKGGAK